MSKVEVYLEKYKELEKVVRSTYNLKDNDSISYYLKNQDKYRRNKDEITYCQDVRNFLVHDKKISNEFPVEPSEEMIKFISELIEKVKNRKQCCDIQVGVRDVYSQPRSGKVKDTMIKMRNEKYSCVPIMENGIVVGVFDENSIFNYLSDEEIIEISNDLTFEAISSYIHLDGREMEKFIFFKPSRYVDDLEIEFEKAYKKGERIGAVFLTQNGKPEEKLLGFLTLWDILNKNK